MLSFYMLKPKTSKLPYSVSEGH